MLKTDLRSHPRRSTHLHSTHLNPQPRPPKPRIRPGTSPPSPKRLPFEHHLFVYTCTWLKYRCSWKEFVDGFPHGHAHRNPESAAGICPPTPKRLPFAHLLPNLFPFPVDQISLHRSKFILASGENSVYNTQQEECYFNGNSIERTSYDVSAMKLLVHLRNRQPEISSFGTVQKSPICGKNTFTIYAGFAPPYMAIKRLLR